MVDLNSISIESKSEKNVDTRVLSYLLRLTLKVLHPINDLFNEVKLIFNRIDF